MDLKELETIASREMMKHGLHGWSFGLAHAKRQLGVCKYRKKRIEIAEYYALNSPQESVLDTLLRGRREDGAEEVAASSFTTHVPDDGEGCRRRVRGGGGEPATRG